MTVIQITKRWNRCYLICSGLFHLFRFDLRVEQLELLFLIELKKCSGIIYCSSIRFEVWNFWNIWNAFFEKYHNSETSASASVFNQSFR